MRGAPALDWAEGTGVRTLEVAQGASESRAGFSALDSEVSGVRFTNVLSGDLSLTNAVAHNGAGVAIGDVDGDGWPDLYFCALQGPNRLYRNLGGMRFEEMPLGDAACANQLSTGAAFADVDGDGDLDLLVNGIGGGTRLFLNDGRGSWTEMRESGLSRSASATSMALADIDGDGDLDLYVTHYIDVMHLADPTTRFALARDGGDGG
jgi:enediyne biosynthesis protein E4